MCCFLTTLVVLGPRAAVLVWWLFDADRWQAAFSSFFWPLLGFIFAPWTTLAYVAVFPNGLVMFDWIILGLAIMLDIFSWAGGAYGNRNRYGYSTA